MVTYDDIVNFAVSLREKEGDAYSSGAHRGAMWVFEQMHGEIARLMGRLNDLATNRNDLIMQCANLTKERDALLGREIYLESVSNAWQSFASQAQDTSRNLNDVQEAKGMKQSFERGQRIAMLESQIFDLKQRNEAQAATILRHFKDDAMFKEMHNKLVFYEFAFSGLQDGSKMLFTQNEEMKALLQKIYEWGGVFADQACELLDKYSEAYRAEKRTSFDMNGWRISCANFTNGSSMWVFDELTPQIAAKVWGSRGISTPTPYAIDPLSDEDRLILVNPVRALQQRIKKEFGYAPHAVSIEKIPSQTKDEAKSP